MSRATLVLAAPTAAVHVSGDALGRTYTPDALALAIGALLVPLVPAVDGPLRFLEPCLGGGAIVAGVRAAAAARGQAVWAYGVDLDAAAPGRAEVQDGVAGDATRSPWPDHGGRGMYFDLSATNPPFGEEVGQAVTLGIVRAMRRAAPVSSVLLPIDYLTQTGYDAELSECAIVTRVVGRPFPNERGMALYTWSTRHNGPTIFNALRGKWKA